MNDPRGPIRKIVAVQKDPNGGWTLVTLDCGHVREANQIYHYKVGAQYHCSHPGCKQANEREGN